MTATATARLAIPAETLAEALRDTAKSLGMALEEQGAVLSLRLSLGKLDLVPEADGVRLDLSALNDAKLQVLRDTVAERLVAAAPGWRSTGRMGLPPGRCRPMSACCRSRR